MVSAPDDDDMDAIAAALSGLEICGCGCSRSEHDSLGRCLFCGECDEFTLDEDATILAFCREDYPPEGV